MSIDQWDSQTNFRNTSLDRDQLADPLPAVVSKECRICMSCSSEENNPFLSPCSCSGSIKYVHQGCLKEWVQRQILKNVHQDNTNQPQCQLCKSHFVFTVQISKHCSSCAEAKRIINANKFSFGYLTLCLFLCLSLLLFAIIQLILMFRNGFNSLQLPIKIMILCSSIIAIAGLAAILPFYIKFFVREKADLKFSNFHQ